MSQSIPPAPADRNAPAGGGDKAAPGGAADPSMEDILASIRRILSDDEQPGAAKPAAPAATPAPTPPAPAAPPATIAAALPAEESDALPLSEAMLVAADPVPEPAPPPAPMAMPAPAPIAMPGPERLVAPEAEAAAAGSVSSLLRTLTAERDSLPVYRGGPTIEDLVRDEIRPLLKAWLDTHLPPLVERLVRVEIERVVGRVQP